MSLPAVHTCCAPGRPCPQRTTCPPCPPRPPRQPAPSLGLCLRNTPPLAPNNPGLGQEAGKSRRHGQGGTPSALEGPGPGHRWEGGFGPAGSPVLPCRTTRAPLSACPRLGKEESESSRGHSEAPQAPDHGLLFRPLEGCAGLTSHQGSQEQELRAPALQGLEVGGGPGPERRRMSSPMGHARRGCGARDTPLTRTESSSPLRVVRRNQGLGRAARGPRGGPRGLRTARRPQRRARPAAPPAASRRRWVPRARSVSAPAPPT